MWHLQKAHIILFQTLLRLLVLENEEVQLTQQWRSRLRNLHRTAKSARFFEMRFDAPITLCDPEDDEQLEAWISVFDNCICLIPEAGGGKCYKLFDVSFIPNCLIKHEPVTQTSYLRNLFLRSEYLDDDISFADEDIEGLERLEVTTEETLPINLSCNAKLLAERIQRTLDEPIPDGLAIDDRNQLSEWLLLNQACDCPVRITPKMLRTCLLNDQPSCLLLLLGRRFSPKAEVIRGVAHHTEDGFRRATSVTEHDLRKLRVLARRLDNRNRTAYTGLIDMAISNQEALIQEAAELGFGSVSDLEDFVEDPRVRAFIVDNEDVSGHRGFMQLAEVRTLLENATGVRQRRVELDLTSAAAVAA